MTTPMLPDGEFVRCPYADDHPRIEEKIRTLEREMGEARRKGEDHGKEWADFLIAFGELKARVEGLRGQVAGYLVAGMIVAAGVSALMNWALTTKVRAEPHSHPHSSEYVPP